MAGWAGWRPAISAAWPRSESPATAMASATNSACSSSISRMAGRSNIPRSGCNSAIPGSSNGLKSPIRSSSSAVSRAARMGRRANGSIPRRCWRSPMTRRWPAGEAARSTPCACGRQNRPTPSASPISTAATIWARWKRRCCRRTCPGCSIRMTPRRSGRSCGCGRSISSPPHRCRTSCGATASITEASTRFRTRWRFSSTTPIRQSRCRSSCGC